MKEYLSFEGLSRFFDNLVGKFSVIGHTHTKSEITDFQDLILVISDDDNGNVVMEYSYLDANDFNKVNSLETEVATIKSTINDINNNIDVIYSDINNINNDIDEIYSNDYLVANNASN